MTTGEASEELDLIDPTSGVSQQIPFSSIDPDVLYVDDPNYRTFTWYNRFAIQTSDATNFSHAALDLYLKNPARYKMTEQLVDVDIMATNMPRPLYPIHGRFGHLTNRYKIKYPIIAIWKEPFQTTRFPNDTKYFEIIENTLYNIFKYDRSKLLYCVGDNVIQLGNRKMPLTDTSSENDDLIDLKRKYHQETDPIKKKELAMKLGIVPVMPEKPKMPIIGDSFKFKDLVNLVVEQPIPKYVDYNEKKIIIDGKQYLVTAKFNFERQAVGHSTDQYEGSKDVYAEVPNEIVYFDVSSITGDYIKPIQDAGLLGLLHDKVLEIAREDAELYKY